MPKLSGLIVVLTTPFKDGRIDESAFREHVQRLAPFVSGYVIGGTTGESASLSDAELQTLVRVARTCVHGKLFIAGFWRETQQAALETARVIGPLVDILLVPLTTDLFAADEKEILEFYTKFNSSVPNPILLYNFPAKCAGRSLSLELTTKLARLSKVVGVKDSSEDAKLAFDIIEHNLALQPLLGNDRFLFPFLQGLQRASAANDWSSISGASSVPLIAEIQAQIYQLVKNKDYVQAQALQRQLISVFFEPWRTFAAQLKGQPPVMKDLISRELPGYPTEVRAPLLPITPEISSKLKCRL